MTQQIDYYHALIAVGILTFFWRYLLVAQRGKICSPDDDSIVHLYFVKMHTIAPGKFSINEDKRFLVGPKTYYPQFFHKFLATLFGFEKCMKYRQYFNPVFDALFNMALFSFAHSVISLTPQIHRAELISFIVSMLYILSPIMFYFEARTVNFGERLFSYILGMLTLIYTIYYLQRHQPINLAAVLLLNVLIIYSSQFSLQAVLALQLIFSLVTGNPGPIMTVIGAVGLSFLLTPRLMSSYVKAKYRHYEIYFRYLKNKKQDLRSFYHKLLRRLPLYGLVYVILLFKAEDMFKLWGNPVFGWLGGYLFASVVVFMMVYLPFFRPFGEAVRYLEYSIPFAILLLVYICFLKEYWLLLGVFSTINLLITIYYIIEMNMKDSDDRSLTELTDFLKQHEEKVILPIPLKLAYYLAMFLKNNIVASQVIPEDYEQLDKITKKVGCPINDFEKIKKQYHFDWVIYIKGFDSGYDFSRNKIVYQDEKYIVFEM